MATTPTNTSASVMTYNSLIQDIQQYLERSDPAVVNQIPSFIMLAEFEIAQQMKTLGQLQVVTSVMTVGNPIIPKPARWRKTVSMNLSIPTDTSLAISYASIPNAILEASLNIEPAKTLFKTTTIGGRALGDINNSGTVTPLDTQAYLQWANNANANPTQVSYIENVMNPYILANPITYANYLLTIVNSQTEPILLRKYEYLRQYAPSVSITGIPLYCADYDYDNWLVAPTPDQAYNFEVLYYERLAPLSADNQTNWITRNAPNAMLYGTLLQAMPFLKNDQRVVFQQKYDQATQFLKQEDQLRLADRQAIAIDG